MAVKKEESTEYKRLRNNISFNIRKYRKEKHLTQEELAEHANISYDFMRRIENTKGGCGFSVFTLYKIALALGVTMDELADMEMKGKTDIK